MTQIRNFRDLQSEVQESLALVLQTKVDAYVKKKVNKRIKTDVYGSYSPQVYKRKNLLYIDKNHHKSLFTDGGDNVYYKYEHRAMIGGKNLSKLIILGQEGARRYNDEPIAMYNDKYITEYKNSGASDSKPFFEPRNFMSGAKSDINVAEIVDILKRG